MEHRGPIQYKDAALPVWPAPCQRQDVLSAVLPLNTELPTRVGSDKTASLYWNGTQYAYQWCEYILVHAAGIRSWKRGDAQLCFTKNLS